MKKVYDGLEAYKVAFDGHNISADSCLYSAQLADPGKIGQCTECGFVEEQEEGYLHEV